MGDENFVFLTAGIPGVVAFDRGKNVVAGSDFPQDARKILDRIDRLEDGETVEELEETLKKLETKNVVTDLPLEAEGFHFEVKDEVSAREYLRNHLRKVSKEIDFVKNDEEFSEILRDVQIIKTREEVKTSVGKDKVLSQAVSALDDLKEVSNELSERLREWYGLYYPEFETDSNERYAELVGKIGGREGFDGYKGSMGVDLDGEDIEAIQKFAVEIKDIYKIKSELESYLEDAVPEIAPNISHLIGGKMAAKLISIAGSLEDLAKMPSSKIQLLGAEKALFRHLKGGGKPPKYGIIYNHPYIQRTDEGKRGKVARAIASKLMMAARTDQYTDSFKGKKYKEDLEEKIKKVRKS